MEHVYSVGMGSDTQNIIASDAEAAAFYYFLHCVNANVPAVAIYTEDGKEWNGDSWWLALSLGAIKMPEDEMLKRFAAIKERLSMCRLMLPGETQVAFDTYVNNNL